MDKKLVMELAVRNNLLMQTKIESIRLKNFKAFKDATMRDMPALCVIVGANGSGKTTLFDVFGFLRDSMTENVQVALSRRGGFKEFKTRDAEGPIEIELKFRFSSTTQSGSKMPLATYTLAVNERDGKAVVEREELKYRRGRYGQPWRFLSFAFGKGEAVTNEFAEVEDERDLERDEHTLASPNILAIKGLGQFQQYPVVMALGQMIENWHVSDFHINSAQRQPDAGYAEHLSSQGENLALVTQFLHEHHRDIFDQILQKLAERVPGISKVEAKTSEEGRVLLKFKDGAFKDPFLSRYVSDGTIKMFAYLLLLYDPAPHPLLCVEEPENQLYPTLLYALAEEFEHYATQGGQVLVSTHSPDFLNAVDIESVFWLVKEKGFTQIKRAKDDKQICKFMADGDKMGYLWKQGFFEGANPL